MSARTLPGALIIYLIGAVSFVTVRAAAPSASIDYKLPKTTTLGEPVLLVVKLINSTGARIVVDFGVEDQTEFILRLTKPDGTVERVQPSIAPPNRMRTSRLMLRGNSYTANVVLDRWLRFDQPGRYTIDVEYRGSVQIEGGNSANVKRTATFALDVKPRDSRRLEQRAAAWLKQVSTLSPGPETRAATSALVAMTDAVAIPYLELATVRTRSPQFVDALAAMKDPEARATLERLAASSDPDVRAMALRVIVR